jgi:hypothetical protein
VKVIDRAKLLVGGYLALSVLTLAAVALLRDNPAVVNDAVWVRSGIVVATAALMYAFATRAARGSRGGYRRLRFMSAVMVVAIAVIVALPGSFPLWLKIEQGVCGLLLIGVTALVNSKAARSSFATT